MKGDPQPHTYTSPWLSEYRCLFHLLPLLPLFFTPVVLSFSLPFSFIPPLFPACSPPPFPHSLSFSPFPSLQLQQAAAREEVSLGQPQTGNICSIFRLPARPFLRPMCPRMGETTPPFTPLGHSILWLFSFQPKREFNILLSILPILFLFLSLPRFKATLPLYLTLLAV